MYDDKHTIFHGTLLSTEAPAYAPSKLERFGKWLIGVPADCDPAREKTLRQAKRNREAAIEHEIKAHECTFDTISKRLKDALDMVEDCGKMYRCANDAEKRMMNQAIFSKIWVERDGHVTVDFAKPFDTLVEPFTDVITRLNKEKIRSTEVPADFFSVIANRLSSFLVNV